MRSIILIFMTLVLSACVFMPEEPPYPDHRFVDRLNLKQIVYGINAEFNFSSYRELFESSGDLFIGADEQPFTTDMFVLRLEEINRDTTVSCKWIAEPGGDFPTMEINRPTTLRLRSFVISSQNPESDGRTGNAQITIVWNGIKWQITRWREIGEDYSFFNPNFWRN